MVSTDGKLGESELNVADLDWMSREILRNLDETEGTANTAELKTRTGIKNTGSINHRLDYYLKPTGLVETLRPEPENGRNPPKVLTLTSKGEEVAGAIREVESGDDEEDRLPLDQRLERLESALESDYGMVSLSKKNELETTVEMMRVMRDFLLEEHDSPNANETASAGAAVEILERKPTL